MLQRQALGGWVGDKRAVFGTALKMLRTAFAVLSAGEPCRDPDIDNERLFVKRNAARWRLTLKEHGFVKAGTGDSADLSHGT